MTCKDFQLIADALRRSRPTVADFTTTSADGRNTFTNRISFDAADSAWSNSVRVMSDHLRATNPRFDRERFTRACETAR